MEGFNHSDSDMRTKANYIGVSPNPASSLSWPMSYSSAAPSHERSAAAPGSNSSSVVSATSMRYDPIRHDHTEAQAGRFASPMIPDLMQQKRKRLEEKLHPEKTTQVFSYEPQKIVIPTNSLQSGKRNHICDICGATFTRQHNLKSHFLTHTSSKKEFICSNCGSEFRRSHDLKRHQKLHTGEKPFACGTCGRRFARADALGRHTKSSGDGVCVNTRKSDSESETPLETQVDLRNASVSHESNQSETNLNYAIQADASSAVSNEHSLTDATNLLKVRMETTNAMENHEETAARNSTFATKLPPLHTALAIEQDRSEHQYKSPTNTRDIMSTPHFGLSFDSRSLSTHPLSFDRNSVPETSSTPTTNNVVQAMVPLQRYRQLELEHQAAMERIRHFEGEHGT